MGIKYVKCPRCDFNWIPDNEQYCEICKKELHLTTNVSFIGDKFDEDESQILCPKCRMNYMDEGEEMCLECRQELQESLAAEGEKEKWDASSNGEDGTINDGEDMNDWADGGLDVTAVDEEMMQELADEEEAEEEAEQEAEGEKEEDGYGDDFDDMFLDEEFEDDGEEDEDDEGDDGDE